MEEKTDKTWINSGQGSTSKGFEMVVITDKAGLVETAHTGDDKIGDWADVLVCVYVCVCVCVCVCVRFYTVCGVLTLIQVPSLHSL